MLYSLVLSKKPDFRSEYLDETIVDLLGTSYEMPSSYNCEVFRVPGGFEARPDLISLNAYGDELDSDILVKLNCKGNAFELAEDGVMVAPEYGEIQRFIVSPSSRWESGDADLYSKRERKRRLVDSRKQSGSGNAKGLRTGPNAALVSDKRFNIDQLSRVVIY